MSIDRSHPLAVRRLQGGGRPAGPGVRPLLRDADRLLPRRLPDRAPARRRQAARLPRLPDEVHRHRRRPTPSSATSGKQVRDNIHSADLIAAFDAFRERPAPAAVYNIGGGRDSQLLDARGDRGLRADRRAASSTGSWARSRGSATTAGGSPTSARSEADYPDWSCATGSRRSCGRCTSRTSSAGRRRAA